METKIDSSEIWMQVGALSHEELCQKLVETEVWFRNLSDEYNRRFKEAEASLNNIDKNSLPSKSRGYLYGICSAEDLLYPLIFSETKKALQLKITNGVKDLSPLELKMIELFFPKEEKNA